MVFEPDGERGRLVAELQSLAARPAVVAWIADPATDLHELTTASAVPFWNEIMRLAERSALVLGEPAFDLALQAYLAQWRIEAEQRELFDAAQILAKAAQDHLSSRSRVGD